MLINNTVEACAVSRYLMFSVQFNLLYAFKWLFGLAVLPANALLLFMAVRCNVLDRSLL